MMLHELKPAQGATKAAKRKGRGHGSGTVSYTHLTLPTKLEV